MTVTYEQHIWQDGDEGGTPILAAWLNHLEEGVADVDDALATKLDVDNPSANGVLQVPGVKITGGSPVVGKSLICTNADGSAAWGNWPPTPFDPIILGYRFNETRALGVADPMGVKILRACVIEKAVVRCQTADASGSLALELRRNGSTIAGTSTSISTQYQTAGFSLGGPWNFIDGDVLTIHINSMGPTPGKGLVVELKGLA